MIEFLKDEDSIGPGRLDRRSVQENGACGWFDVTADRFQNRRFTATGGAKNDVAIRLADPKVDVLTAVNESLPFA